MGTCGTNINDDKYRVRKVDNNSIIPVAKSRTQLEKSVCKIKLNEGNGTGFICKIPFPDESNLLPVFITNNHVLREKDIKIDKKIQITFDNDKIKKEIKINKSRIKYTNSDLDLTIIEIKPKEDKINDNDFLTIENNLNENDFKNKKIYVLQYPNNFCCSSYGKIKQINNEIIQHTCSIDDGSSGAPIMSIDQFKVIGVHKGKTTYNYNEGIFIKNIIQEFNKKIKKINLKNDDYYLGEWRNGLKHGIGIIYYNDGTMKYNGQFKEGKYEGKGKYFYRSGNYYDGEWLNGLKHGIGTIYYEDGTIKFFGNFVNGKIEGYGKFNEKNGEYYEGNWLNNLPHGKGKTYYKNGEIKYDGDFIEGKFEGKGKYIYYNKNYYEGEWLNNLPHGKGKIYYNNGNIKYDMYFKNGKIKDGEGKVFYRNGQLLFEGFFIRGKYDGKGKKYYKDGKILFEGIFAKGEYKNGKEYYKNGIIFDGEWTNNSKDGVGMIKYIEGDYFVGEWIDHLRNGKGAEYYKDNTIKFKGNYENDEYNGYGRYFEDKTGEIYDGQWKNGFKNGMGTEYYRDGKTIKYIGNFVNGKYEGKGKYYDKSGEMYDGSWKKGLKHGKGYECDKNGIIIKECYYKKGKLKKNDKRSKTE